MKNFLLKSLITIACLTSSTISNAQYNVIKLDALGLIYPGLTVFRPSYERNLGKYFSLSLGFETGKYASGSSGNVGSSNMKEVYSLKGWGFMTELRAYPFSERKDAPIGVFFGGHLRYRALHENYNGKDFSVQTNSCCGGGTPAPDVSISNPGSLVDLGIHTGYKGKAGQFIFEPLIGVGTGFVSGFSQDEREKMDPFYADPINIFWNLLRVQFSVGFIFPKVKMESQASKKSNNVQTQKRSLDSEGY